MTTAVEPQLSEHQVLNLSELQMTAQLENFVKKCIILFREIEKISVHECVHGCSVLHTFDYPNTLPPN